jgi:selenide,water dikinase
MTTEDSYRLTQYSHGAGCGCKIAPDVLDRILAGSTEGGVLSAYPNLLVGNSQRDDAAAFAIDGERAILSTTDFFMPIVDDAFDFGRIAATNAISDIYAMGGTPLMAIAILGWPIDKLPVDVAGQVIAGGRAVCAAAGIPLAGGHSIDAPEPLFGLAVTGEVAIADLKRNSGAQPGDRLFLTKPLGIGILTTAEKRASLHPDHARIATETMCQLNRIGQQLASVPGVHAMTDVTGFGLFGHLLELCDASGVSALLDTHAVATLPGVETYLAAGCVPGGSHRNFTAYGHRLPDMPETLRQLFCDPQTSGGLLIAVAEDAVRAVTDTLRQAGLPQEPIGQLLAAAPDQTTVRLRW